MSVEQQPPLPVAQLDGSAGGADDVGEEDTRQHTVRFWRGTSTGEELLGLAENLVGVLGPPEVIGAR